MDELRKKLILVVDDVEDNRDMYAQFLSYKGYQVALAGEGQEALEKALELQPDLIVMDLALPVMDGWETTRRLKGDARSRRIPVLALTAHAFEGVADGARAAGCDGCIKKPCAPEKLVEHIENLLAASERSLPAGNW